MPLFTNKRIVYAESPKESTKTLTKPTGKFNKFTG